MKDYHTPCAHGFIEALVIIPALEARRIEYIILCAKIIANL
jgi:hypothetical protein